MGTLRLSLRAGERIYINGAVMRVDRKTQLELLNDVTFLLESHVMQASETTTPLRQLYFIVQMMLIDPVNATAAREVFEATNALLVAAFENPAVRNGLLDAADLVTEGRTFDALKRVRGLLPLEDSILGTPDASDAVAAVVPMKIGARA